YSLAHRAYLYGEPVVPPLVYYYQDDPNVREMGSEKLLGRDLLVATASTANQFERTVYLPAGPWFDTHTGQRYESTGQEFGPFPLYPEGILHLPMFARAGAIIPTMYVDEQTMNVFGRRLDGTTRDELIVRVYAGAEPTAFTLYEDDGTTIAYQQGEVRTTRLSQQQTGQEVAVTIAAASGTYAGAPGQRDNVVRLYVEGFAAGGVTLNGTALPRLDSQSALDAAASGWYDTGAGLIVAKSGVLAVGQEKVFRFALAAPVLPTAGLVGEPLPSYWPTTDWQRAAPEQVGMDSPTLARAVDYLACQDMLLHRWLLVRQGYVVVDAAFARELPAEPFARESTTTGFLSTLVGIAIDQGAIPSVDEPVVNFFPDRTIAHMDARKKALTLEDLLTMRSGLECQPLGTMVEMQARDDWVQYVLDLPMAADPGTTYNPCEVNAHLVAAILQQATGLPAIDYARERLFAPLGIPDVAWAADPQGVNQGWAGLQMDAADTAKLGLLYLRGGEWDGQQVVSADWIAAATQWQVTFDQQAGYGYLWHTDPQGYFTYAPLSQWLIVVPAADMVLVPTGGLLEEDGFQIHVLASSFLAPATRANTPLPENPAGVEALQASLSAADGAIEPQPVPPLPDIAREISGQRYTLMEEEIGWEVVSLSFPGGAEAVFYIGGENIDVEEQSITLTIGLDGVPRIRVVPSPIGPVLIGGVGSWESADTFVLDLVQYMAVDQARITIRMTFHGDGLDMTITVEEGTVTVHGSR
ncbi:MAG: DUF5110 domain-containing protein, partial [Anaerolineae bacterium]|nr:DUF5110 domain-containing protein [Anaerolineae bacterium]